MVAKKKKPQTSGSFAELKTMDITGYRGVAGKVEGIELLVLQVILGSAE